MKLVFTAKVKVDQPDLSEDDKQRKIAVIAAEMQDYAGIVEVDTNNVQVGVASLVEKYGKDLIEVWNDETGGVAWAWWLT